MSLRAVTRSPFFAPNPPLKTKPQLITSRTPNGTVIRRIRVQRQKDHDEEAKSSIMGASFNLINAIVGAGIVGIPFAIRECGLVWGVFMVVFCAALTEKSLRLLVETAKHVDVSTYERLCEASFGRPGFLFISFAMFIVAYGAMVSYLMIVKGTLPSLLGVDDDDEYTKRAILTVSSMCFILPLSLQRDMDNLSITSTISVIFDFFVVLIVAIYSPIQTTVQNAGGLPYLLHQSLTDIELDTFFLGIGVLSFAFVCQHSAFIIAGSLDNPTRSRWNTVSGFSLSTCAVFATVMGVTGYLGYLDQTQGNVLTNLGMSSLSPTTVSPK